MGSKGSRTSLFCTVSAAAALLGSIFLLVVFIFETRLKIPYSICHVGDTKEGSTIRTETVRTFNMEDESPSWAPTYWPERHGLVYVKYNETFSPGMGISMFHAMHCVTMLQRMLQPDASGKSSHHNSAASDHAAHCFKYISQYIMCAGDSTIEPPVMIKNAAGNIVGAGVTGHAVEHKCKNTDLLFSVARLSEKKPFDTWTSQPGETVESLFGQDSYNDWKSGDNAENFFDPLNELLHNDPRRSDGSFGGGIYVDNRVYV